MSKIVETIRKKLGEGAPPACEVRPAEERLVSLVEKHSLGALISSAIADKDQGRINEAISKITKANRQQLSAIEAITKTLDEEFQRPNRDVIFAKYRQIAPFEMGVEGADDVLELIRRFQKAVLADHSPVARLHTLEIGQSTALRALAFLRERFTGGCAEADIEEAETTLKSIALELERTRAFILSAVISTVRGIVSERSETATISLSAQYNVAGWLYQIVTSKTLTKSAMDVETA